MNIISRAEWGAAAPRSTASTTWDRRTEFVVHHSEGPTSQTPRAIQAFHQGPERGWSDVGYNFLVDRQGRIYEGRGWLVVGAHATGHNTSGIGVCFIGRDGDVTDAALESIRDLYDAACRRTGRRLDLRGHGQLSGNSTACPGGQLLAWVKAGAPRPATDDWTEKAVKQLPTLRKGQTGEHVQSLQGLLRARSHPEVPETGVFDAVTEAAVREVQEWGRLVPDGIVGPKTWPVLLRVHA